MFNFIFHVYNIIMFVYSQRKMRVFYNDPNEIANKGIKCFPRFIKTCSMETQWANCWHKFPGSYLQSL